MHKLMKLREKLMEELEKQEARPLSESTLTLIGELSRSIKNIDIIIGMEEEASYDGGSRESRRYRDGYSGEYRDDGSMESRYREGGSRESRRYRDEGMSGRRGYFYTQREDGTSGRRRRDSMGRYADSYSNEDGTSGRYSRDEAKDKLVHGLEGMMEDVSPETQHAIEKAIRALERE